MEPQQGVAAVTSGKIPKTPETGRVCCPDRKCEVTEFKCRARGARKPHDTSHRDFCAVAWPERKRRGTRRRHFACRLSEAGESEVQCLLVRPSFRFLAEAMGADIDSRALPIRKCRAP
ncbi:hypothetical protein MRX96_030760 [Rhipicephalus microplus]